MLRRKRGRIALEHREDGHLLVEQPRVGGRDVRAGVRPEDDEPLRLEPPDRLAHGQRRDAELRGQRVDDDPVAGPVGAAQDALADGAVDPLLLRHALFGLLGHGVASIRLPTGEASASGGLRVVEPHGPPGLCASEWSAAPPSSAGASAQRRLTSSQQRGVHVRGRGQLRRRCRRPWRAARARTRSRRRPVSTWSLDTTSVLKLLPVEAFMTSIIVAGVEAVLLADRERLRDERVRRRRRRSCSAPSSRDPEPSGPVRKSRSPSTSSTGCACAIASSSSPPIISVSVPDSARGDPARDRRVDERRRRRGASCDAELLRAVRVRRAHVDHDRARRERRGDTALPVRGSRPARRGRRGASSRPRRRRRTPPGDSAATPPYSATKLCCRAGSASRTTSANPAAARLRAIGQPIFPSPTKSDRADARARSHHAARARLVPRSRSGTRPPRPGCRSRSAAWIRTSRIWSFVTPLAIAPFTWTRISCGLPSATSMAIVSMLRMFRGSSSSRPQTSREAVLADELLERPREVGRALELRLAVLGPEHLLFDLVATIDEMLRHQFLQCQGELTPRPSGTPRRGSPDRPCAGGTASRRRSS